MKKDKNINYTIDHLFRQESGRMVAVLVKIFGAEHIELAEDVVQDALLSALETWKYRGLPDNPRAWLYRTAKNKAIDIIRRKKHSYSFDFSDPERQLLTSEYTLGTTMDIFWQDNQIKDDFLAMIYACCRPEISQENQITFILKILCGFSTKEVAKAFLTSEDTISKRLYRAKEIFRKRKIRPEIPSSEEIAIRTNTVLSVIYLLFNEGYNSTHSNQLIRQDLIAQAMWLCRSLLESEKTQLPEAYALMALMCFQAARFDSRLSPAGELIQLAKQDRRKWDKNLIKLGNEYLNKAAFGDRISPYHLEAAIAYEHCAAKNYEMTDWKAILGYYDSLLAQHFDPIVFLNRCVVILQVDGPQKALDTLLGIVENKRLKNYYLYHAVLGAFYQGLGEKKKAIKSFLRAQGLTQSELEKRFLEGRIVET